MVRLSVQLAVDFGLNGTKGFGVALEVAWEGKNTEERVGLSRQHNRIHVHQILCPASVIHYSHHSNQSNPNGQDQFICRPF